MGRVIVYIICAIAVIASVGYMISFYNHCDGTVVRGLFLLECIEVQSNE